MDSMNEGWEQLINLVGEKYRKVIEQWALVTYWRGYADAIEELEVVVGETEAAQRWLIHDTRQNVIDGLDEGIYPISELAEHDLMKNAMKCHPSVDGKGFIMEEK